MDENMTNNNPNLDGNNAGVNPQPASTIPQQVPINQQETSQPVQPNYQQPVGQPMTNTQIPQQPYQQTINVQTPYPMIPKDPKKPMAIASLILGIFSFLISMVSCIPFIGFLSGIGGIVGIILGAMSMKSTAKGMAIAGLILSILAVLTTGIVLILMIIGLAAYDEFGAWDNYSYSIINMISMFSMR